MRRRIKKWVIVLSAGLLLVAAGSCWYLSRALPVFLGFSAKSLCSGVFVSHRSADDVMRQDVAPMVFFSPLVDVEVDTVEKTVTAVLAGIFRQQALYRSGCGCTLMPDSASAYRLKQVQTGPPLHSFDFSDSIYWPSGSAAPIDRTPSGVDAGRLQEAVADAFEDAATGSSRHTRAVVVVYNGRLLAERYARGFNRNMPLAGWSMSKSITNALVGILVYQGKLELFDPAPVPEWQGPGDPRREITLDQLLRMTSGLRFREVYTPPSDVTEMLFQSLDFGALAASQPLEAPPGQRWHYSSGTTNLISRIIRVLVEPEYGHSVAFARRELFDRLGMRSAVVEPDPSGSIVGSSYTFATARDWARFGLLYLRDGVWQGQRILPPDWVAYSRTPTPAAPMRQYGAHFWLNAGAADNPHRRRWPSLPSDMFVAWGFQGQFLVIVPSHNLVLVRMGLNTDSKQWNLERFVNGVIAALP